MFALFKFKNINVINYYINTNNKTKIPTKLLHSNPTAVNFVAIIFVSYFIFYIFIFKNTVSQTISR